MYTLSLVFKSVVCSDNAHPGCGLVHPNVFLQKVRLHFVKFILESNCSCDNVTIYDGGDTTAPLIRSLYGSGRPADITTTGNIVFVQFRSNSYGRYYGFKIHYSTFVPAEGMT